MVRSAFVQLTSPRLVRIYSGATTFRYGWATENATPYVAPNLISKFRDKRSNRQVLLFGDAVDVDTQARASAKSPWEGDFLNNFEALVRLEDLTSQALVELEPESVSQIGSCPRFRLSSSRN